MFSGGFMIGGGIWLALTRAKKSAASKNAPDPPLPPVEPSTARLRLIQEPSLGKPLA